MLAAAVAPTAFHRVAPGSLRPRRDVRACVRSFREAPTRRVPGRERETEAGARRDTARGRTLPPRAESEVPARPVAEGCLASDAGPGERASPPVH